MGSLALCRPHFCTHLAKSHYLCGFDRQCFSQVEQIRGALIAYCCSFETCKMCRPQQNILLLSRVVPSLLLHHRPPLPPPSRAREPSPSTATQQKESRAAQLRAVTSFPLVQERSALTIWLGLGRRMRKRRADHRRQKLVKARTNGDRAIGIRAEDSASASRSSWTKMTTTMMT